MTNGGGIHHGVKKKPKHRKNTPENMAGPLKRFFQENARQAQTPKAKSKKERPKLGVSARRSSRVPGQVNFECPDCGHSLKAPTSMIGKKCRCTKTECKALLVVPDPHDDPSATTRDRDLEINLDEEMSKSLDRQKRIPQKRDGVFPHVPESNIGPLASRCYRCNAEVLFSAAQVEAAHCIWKLLSGQEGLAATDYLGADATTNQCSCGMEGEIVFTGENQSEVQWRD